MKMPVSPTDCFESMFQGLRDASSTNAAGGAMSFDDGLTMACQMVMGCQENGSTAMFIGNGDSAAIASHMAIDFWKNGGINFHIPRRAYGPVEVLHKALCHAILDLSMLSQGKLDKGDFMS